MSRIVLHLDMDYFFAQIEERENPSLKGHPLVIGADPKKGRGRGVVSTCNYEARKFGIRSGMPISVAWRKCPQAKFLPVRYDLYANVSGRIMKFLPQFAEKFEAAGIDEAYLDVSGLQDIKKAENLAKKIQQEILKTEQLTCSVGIGPNKLVAKIASNFKKPAGLTVVRPSGVLDFLAPQGVEVLYGVGPKTAARLHALGIFKIRDLLKLKEKKLIALFGVWGKTMYEAARGIDRREIEEEYVVKSIGKQHTFPQDTRDEGLITQTLLRLAKEVWLELCQEKFLYRTVTITIRYWDFETHTCAKTLTKPTNSLIALKAWALKLIIPFLLKKKKVRMAGVRVSGLILTNKKSVQRDPSS